MPLDEPAQAETPKNQVARLKLKTFLAVSKHLPLPPMLKRLFEKQHLTEPVLSIGPKDAGTPMHQHGASFLTQMIGHKKWMVYPAGLRPKERALELSFGSAISIAAE